jgi:hypothetical protein
MYLGCDYRQGMDWGMDLLTQLETTSNYSVIAIYTLYKSLAYAKSSQSSLLISWQQISTQ